VTIGVVAVAYGEKYRGFIPRWMRAISALERQPDRVMIITDDAPLAIASLGSANLSSVAFKQAYSRFKHHPQVLVNEAIEAINTDWVCKMDIDDLIFPHALNNLDKTDADVYMFGIQLSRQQLLARHATSADILKSPHNLVFSGSPFRRWVWEQSPYRDMVCEDWMFWVDAARNGAKFVASPNIDYEYVIHGDNITLHVDQGYWEDVVRRTREAERGL
jgi:hypothetical protein